MYPRSPRITVSYRHRDHADKYRKLQVLSYNPLSEQDLSLSITARLNGHQLDERQIANLPPLSGSTLTKVSKSFHDLSVHDPIHVSWTN